MPKVTIYFYALLESKCPGLAAAYCDNNDGLWDTKVQGIHVLSPELTVKQYPEAVYVIANLGSAQAIKSQLQGMGIIEKQICFFHEPENLLLFHMHYQYCRCRIRTYFIRFDYGLFARGVGEHLAKNQRP